MNVFNLVVNNDTFKEKDGVIFDTQSINGEHIRCEKIEGKVIITTNFLASPRIAYTTINNIFHFSCDRKRLEEFIIQQQGCVTYKEVTEFPMYRFKESVKKDYMIDGVNYIENWAKVIIYPDGAFTKEDYPLKPYSLPLRDAYDNLHKLFIKYKKVVDTLIDMNQFTPTITGGLDTRILTCLYRDRVSELDGFYLRSVKQDGKNHEELGANDLQCATRVANTLGIMNHIELKPNYTKTVTGMFTEGTRGLYDMEINDDRFIYKFIQHHASLKGAFAPFTDDLFLEIKHPNKNVFRCLMILLVSKDLSTLPCIGTQALFERWGHKPYDFYEEFKDVIPEAQEILDYWGEEKCKNILKEDEL